MDHLHQRFLQHFLDQGHRRAHGARGRGGDGSTSAACASRSRSPTSPATRG
jgi:hypothetical protein